MESIQRGNAGNKYTTRTSSMETYGNHDSKSQKQLHNQEGSRQSRSPLREFHAADALTSRDKSTSSTEKQDSPAKRNSFFTKRPKSAVTTGSNENSTRSQTPGVGESSRPTSTVDAPIVPAETDTSRSRFLFGRSRKNRKSGSSKLRASSPVDADDEWDHYRSQKEDKHRRSVSGDRRMRISNPFGFQHVAKIEKQRESRESSDIFADFRALRSGHRTAVIGPSRGPQSDLLLEESRPLKRPPPLRPKRSDELLKESHLLPSSQDILPLRQIRSAEHFTAGIPSAQPPHPFNKPGTTRNYAHRPQPLNQVPNTYGLDYRTAPLDHSSLSDEWDRLLPLYDPRIPNPNEMGFHPMLHQELIPEPIRSPMFQPPLEQVPEEPEGTLSNRQSMDYSRQASIRHSKSSPILSRKGSKPSNTSTQKQPPLPANVEITVTERPASQGSDTLGDPARMSVPVKELEELNLDKFHVEAKELTGSWEDDVDFCYRHAAEADCEFDWNSTSRLDITDSDDLYHDDGLFPDAKRALKREKNHSLASTASSEGDQYKLTSRVYGDNRATSKESCPELDYRSSHSASTNSIAVMTPSDKFSFPVSEKPNKDPLSPALTPLSQVSMSQFYDDILARNATSPPAIPERSDSRPEKARSGDSAKHFEPHLLLPTPPPSINPSPIIPQSDGTKSPHRDLSVDTIVAQLRARTSIMDSPVSPNDPTAVDYPPPPPPKSPRTLARQPSSEMKGLRPRGQSFAVNAAKLKLIEAQGRLQEFAPTSMPRTYSDDSVVTAIPVSKPPTPPKTPFSPEEVPIGPTFLGSPSPSASPVIGNETPQFTPRSTSLPQQPKEEQMPQTHRKVSSDSAAKLDTPPTSPSIAKSPSTSGVRPARSSYSLFPQPPKDLPKPLDLKTANRANFHMGVMSPPPTASLYPMGHPAGTKAPAGLKSPRPKERRLATA